MNRVRIGWIPLLAILAFGCGSRITATVNGQLVYPDGTPAKGLEGHVVIFEGVGPDGKNYSANGVVNAQGEFELTTEKPGDGAPIGLCKVMIARRQIDAERTAPAVIDRKFESFDTSGLEFEVKPGANRPTLTVTPLKKK